MKSRTPRIGEKVLRKLAEARYRKNLTRRAQGRGESFEAYFKWQFESTERLFRQLPGNPNLRGKTVIEVGCGTGGRTAWFAAQGASRVVGIDINHQEIQIARQLCQQLKPELVGKVEFLESREDDLEQIGKFDVVFLIDSMEHVVHPPNMLRLCFEYANAGGECYISNMGWWHHAGSHLSELLVPWVQIFFTDEAICNTMRHLLALPEYEPNRFDSDPPVARWLGIYNLRDRPGEHLNKISIREMRLLVKYSLFEEGIVRVNGYSNSKLRLINFVRHIPGLEEIFHSNVSIKLRKSS